MELYYNASLFNNTVHLTRRSENGTILFNIRNCVSKEQENPNLVHPET